jgi:hypothetical protein
VKDRFPLVIGALAVLILALGVYGLSGCGSAPPARGPSGSLPVMYEFSSDT